MRWWSRCWVFRQVLEFHYRSSHPVFVRELEQYRKATLKLAELKFLGKSNGCSARIPSFKGLIVFGETKTQAIRELETALDGWIELSLARGEGLPSL